MQTSPKPMPEDAMDSSMGDTSVIRETNALTSWATTRPELNAGPLMRAFVRFNVYLYSKPPGGIQKRVNKFFLNVNVWAYQRSQGRIMGRFGDLDALLLHTMGRKSGKPRVVPLGYQFENGVFYAVAVPGHFDVPGGPKAIHPAWYLNVKATPEATIDIGREQIDVVVDEIHGAERDRIWKMYTDVYPFIWEFQNRASRLIPVVRFTPKDMLTDGK
jgi:deazaflavin-dependent oxidoreductase (nitroreductase family)